MLGVTEEPPQPLGNATGLRLMEEQHASRFGGGDGSATSGIGNTSRVRAVYIDLDLHTSQFNQLHDTLFVYPGGEDRSSAPLHEFYGSSYSRTAQQNSSSLSSS